MQNITQDTQETHALHYTVNTCTNKILKLHHTDTLHRKHMHNSKQETHALHYTGNTCTTLYRKHMHNSTQETHAQLYTGSINYITQETHA